MKFVSKLALAVALAAPTLVMADDATTATAPSNNTGAITFTGGADIATSYYFRGYLQENSGIIVQPYVAAMAQIVKSDDFSLALGVETWNSVHSVNGSSADNPAEAGAGPDIWYENDIYVTAPMKFGNNLTVTPAYNVYQSPSSAFQTIQEGAVTVAYDDSDMWTKMNMDGFKLSPYITAAYETSNGNDGANAHGNGGEKGYTEFGIVPSYNVKIGSFSLPIQLPVLVGTGWDGYFSKSNGHNSFFGYLQAGVTTQIAIPTSIIPEKYGSWAIDAGVYYMNLLADSTEAANHDGNNVVWGKVGFTFSY